MALSPAKRKSNDKWIKENYRQVKLSMPNKEADALESHCQKFNYTKAGFIREAIAEKIERDIISPKKEGSPIKEKPTMVATQKDNDVDDDLTEEIPMWKKCHFPSEEAYNAQLEKARESETDYGYCFDEIIASHTKEKESKESNLCPWEDEY